jgi:hypothetical protein
MFTVGGFQKRNRLGPNETLSRGGKLIGPGVGSSHAGHDGRLTGCHKRISLLPNGDWFCHVVAGQSRAVEWNMIGPTVSKMPART